MDRKSAPGEPEANAIEHEHTGGDVEVTMRDEIRTTLTECLHSVEHLLADDKAAAAIERAATLMIETFQKGGCVFSCGNGGSMCDAMHFAEELSGKFRKERRALPAEAISDAAHITCTANDFGFAEIFARYVEAHARSGDFLLAISTSGRSPNILKAAVQAKAQGVRVVALTGKCSSELGRVADVEIATPAGRFSDRVQELHIKVIHLLIELCERRLFPENYR